MDAPYFLFGREKKVKAPIQDQGAVTLQEIKLRELCLFPTYEEPSSTMTGDLQVVTLTLLLNEAIHKAELAKHMELEKRMDLESAVGPELAKYFITVNEKFIVNADHVESALDTLGLDAMTTRKS
nr:hypothetical protein Iba_chr07aCG8210 [Ipomoea batatas]